ncbi:PilZ domain-containing protein [Desulfogranum marinum]|uniref:PilZ domain-containing protein n=1 Tax=Desulfogranum marinum TaxID=453220 RepID=UPI0029C90CCA|nr:PilZ domain-containing protein [Desulfogranum marinum]
MMPQAIHREERRKHPRYKVKQGTLAFVEANPCEIIDISESGMAINYIAFNERRISSYKFDLFSSDKETYLPHLPGEIVTEIALVPPSLFSVIRTKRLGVQFEDLTLDQRSLLRYFIVQSAGRGV